MIKKKLIWISILIVLFFILGCKKTEEKKVKKLQDQIEEQQKDIPQGPNDNSGIDDPPLPT